MSERVRFMVVDFPSPYNIILGRPTIHNWDMLVSTKHQKLKLDNKKNEVVIVKGDQKEYRQCYFKTVKESKEGPLPPPWICCGNNSNKAKMKLQGKSVNLVELDLREEDKISRTKLNRELEDLVLGTKPG